MKVRSSPFKKATSLQTALKVKVSSAIFRASVCLPLTSYWDWKNSWLM